MFPGFIRYIVVRVNCIFNFELTLRVANLVLLLFYSNLLEVQVVNKNRFSYIVFSFIYATKFDGINATERPG